MKRTQIGIIALLLLVGAAIRYAATGNLHDAVLGGLMRIGLVMGALWLAMPQLVAIFVKTPKWLLIALAASVAVFALRPQLLWWLPVALFAVWIAWFAWSRIGSGLLTGFASAPRSSAPRRPKRKM
jgi:hypothetical protein